MTALDDPIGRPAITTGNEKTTPGHETTRDLTSVEMLAVLLVLLLILRSPLAGLISDPRLQTWLTVFVSVLVQAVPFLVFGVVLSAVIAVYVPPSFWAKALPSNSVLAVPVAEWPEWCCPVASAARCRSPGR